MANKGEKKKKKEEEEAWEENVYTCESWYTIKDWKMEELLPVSHHLRHVSLLSSWNCMTYSFLIKSDVVCRDKHQDFFYEQ